MLESKDVAERLSLSVRHVRSLLGSRQLRHVRVGRRFLVPESALDEFLAAHTVQALHNDQTDEESIYEQPSPSGCL
ncbi:MULTISPECIES: helix-turn-helix domain-containing protein [Phaeobacter]